MSDVLPNSISSEEIDAVIRELEKKYPDECHGISMANRWKLNEMAWQRRLAEALGETAEWEVRLWDRTRVDIVHGNNAIELDWASKWAEGIGQSLWYAATTRKDPVLCLICTDIMDQGRFIYRAQTVTFRAGIKLWVIDTVGERVDIGGKEIALPAP